MRLVGPTSGGAACPGDKRLREEGGNLFPKGRDAEIALVYEANLVKGAGCAPRTVQNSCLFDLHAYEIKRFMMRPRPMDARHSSRFRATFTSFAEREIQEMIHTIIMPDLGQTSAEGKILRWLKNPGEKIQLVLKLFF